MSDLELTDPYDPDRFESGRRAPEAAPPRPVPPPGEKPAGPTGVVSARAEIARAPVPWKAAASSVPKLRQQPAALPEPSAGGGAFQGFTQDSISTLAPAAGGEAGDWAPEPEPGGDPDTAPGPLAAPPPVWEAWLESARSIPRPILIGATAAAALVAALFAFLVPRGEERVSLAKIRQHPEAFDGRRVTVGGKAGETFTIGGSFVFHLRQGRDTIVVYSRTRRPSPHERVEATGTVSIGYLDGAPRVALFEQEPSP